MPQGLGLGVLGVKNLIYEHGHVAYQIKGLSSRPGYTENFYPTIKLMTLGWGQRMEYYLISSKAWGFAMARHQMCFSFFFKLSQASTSMSALFV